MESSFSNRNRVELHIEELVLHGFPATDRYAIAEALQQRLAELLMNESQLRRWSGDSNRPAVDAGKFSVEANANSRSIGDQIAQNVHSGLFR